MQIHLCCGTAGWHEPAPQTVNIRKPVGGEYQWAIRVNGGLITGHAPDLARVIVDASRAHCDAKSVIGHNRIALAVVVGAILTIGLPQLVALLLLS